MYVACDHVVVAEKHKMRYEMVTVFSILGDSKEGFSIAKYRKKYGVT